MEHAWNGAFYMMIFGKFKDLEVTVMKKIIRILTVICIVLCNIRFNNVSADSFDTYFGTVLNGSSNTVIEGSYSSLKITSGTMTNGTVGAAGAVIAVTLKDGYIFEKVTVKDSIHNTLSQTSTSLSFEAGDVIDKIEIGVIDTVDAYNKPIAINATTLKYGVKKSEFVAIATDSDLVLMGKNIFDSNFEPVEEIKKPGLYSLLLIFDSTQYGHFPGNENHFYYNTATINGFLIADREVVKNYNLQYGSKEVNLSTDSENHYLYLLQAYNLPGLSVEYLANAGNDAVTNMPANELNAYLKDASVTVNSNSVPVRDGYEFKGWSTSEDGSAVTTVTMPADGLKLYALWYKPGSEVPHEVEMSSAKESYQVVNTCTR